MTVTIPRRKICLSHDCFCWAEPSLCLHTGAPLAPLFQTFFNRGETKPMKLFQALFVAGFAVIPALISAASPYDSIYVHVPFAFEVAGQSFSPGDYRIQRSDNGLILIQGNGKAAATISVPGPLARAWCGHSPAVLYGRRARASRRCAGRRGSNSYACVSSRRYQETSLVLPINRERLPVCRPCLPAARFHLLQF
jgi:hypothetical protein